MKNISLALIVLFAAGLVAFGGCSTAEIELIPAKGVVNIDGQPAAGIMVQFMPDIIDETVSAVTSQGLTNDAGEFTLQTLKGDPGAMAGKHRVTLIDTLEERPAQGEVSRKKPRLAAKYASGNISVIVSSADQVHTIEASGP